VRAVIRSLVALFVAAAAGAAACAHYAIDIVGDFALPHDTYDDVAHGSREFLSVLAIAIAAVLALRGLRYCCEIGARQRLRVGDPALTGRAGIAFVALTALFACALVPAMELFDAHLAGRALDDLGDAFGGSVRLGLGITLICAVAIAAVTYALAWWLVSQRLAIAAALSSLVGRDAAPPPSSQRLRGLRVSPRRRRSTGALRLCKRGPPSVDASDRQHLLHNLQGDSRASFVFARVASLARDGAGSSYCLAGSGGNAGRRAR